MTAPTLRNDAPTPPPGAPRARFEECFDVCFERVYAHVLARTGDRALAEHLTRHVLTAAGARLCENDDLVLARFLLRTAEQVLREPR